MTRVLFLLAFLAVGCGDDEKPPPPPAGRDSGPDTGVRDAGANDGGRMDGGPDAAVPDAGTLDGALGDGAAGDASMDAGPCTSPADCDDGLVCNGTETCVAGECAGGTPVVCSDGIDCTVDVCIEPSGTCESTADDGLCAIGEMCVTAGSRGCIVPCTGSTALCELVTQCGCRLADGCYVAPMTGSRVCLSAGSAGPGTACTMQNDCAKGRGCRRLTDMVRMCARFCDSDTVCGGTSLCVVPSGDAAVSYCSRPCDPVEQTQCVTGSACTIATDASARAYTDCQVRTGMVGQGMPCTSEAQCAGGYTCSAEGSDGGMTCQRFCTASSSCPAGTTCRLGAPWTIGGVAYGLCR